jgi:hypothetical protein
VVSGEIPRPRSIDPSYPLDLERIVLRALERDIDERYQTAEELQRDLEAYLKHERIVVPRAGVAALLKRVLGERIEQRRKAVRAILRQLDGDSAASGLISADPAFTPTGREPAAGGPSAHDSLAPPSDQSGSGTPSGYSHPSSYSASSQPSSGTQATSPQTVSHMGEAKKGIIGYAIGLGCVVLAIIIATVFMLGPRRTTTTIVAAPAAQGVEAAQPKPGAAATTPNDTVPTLDLDTLAEADAGPKHAAAASVQRSAPRKSPDKASTSSEPKKDKATAAPPAPSAAPEAPSPTNLPRGDNPYQ